MTNQPATEPLWFPVHSEELIHGYNASFWYLQRNDFDENDYPTTRPYVKARRALKLPDHIGLTVSVFTLVIASVMAALGYPIALILWMPAIACATVNGYQQSKESIFYSYRNGYTPYPTAEIAAQQAQRLQQYAEAYYMQNKTVAQQALTDFRAAVKEAWDNYDLVEKECYARSLREAPEHRPLSNPRDSAPTPTPVTWEAAKKRHEKVKEQYGTYKTRLSTVYTYPLLFDTVSARTETFEECLVATDDAQHGNDLNEYSEAVRELEDVWEALLLKATNEKDGAYPETAREVFAKARKLAQKAESTEYGAEQRELYRKALKLGETTTVAPPLELVERLQLA